MFIYGILVVALFHSAGADHAADPLPWYIMPFETGWGEVFWVGNDGSDSTTSFIMTHDESHEYRYKGDIHSPKASWTLLEKLDTLIGNEFGHYIHLKISTGAIKRRVIKRYAIPCQMFGVTWGTPDPIMLVRDINLELRYCNFNDYPETICNLELDSTSDLSWELSSSSSKTNTGPVADFTGDGQYMYVDSSGSQPAGSAARMFMPGSGYSKEQCADFGYHMYGADIGTLTLYTEFDGTRTDVWSVSGDQETRSWIAIEVNMYLEDVYTKVGFEAIKGTGPAGDIAVDDIRIMPGRCLHSHEKWQKDYYVCTFDGYPGNVCDMLEPPDEDPTYVLLKFSTTTTPTPQTGPTSDLYGRGHYAYLDSALGTPRQARVLSPELNRTGDVCVEIYHYLYGVNFEQGALYLFKQDGNAVVNMGTVSGNQGPEWIRLFAVTDMVVTTKVGFLLRARGGGTDVAVDNLFARGYNCIDFFEIEYPFYMYWNWDGFPVDIYVQYPFNFSIIPCFPLEGNYQVEVKHMEAGVPVVSCVNDSYSRLTATSKTLTLNTCLQGNSYEKPFQNTELSCVAGSNTTIRPYLLSGSFVDGSLFFLAHTAANGVTNFYTVRYIIEEDNSTLMSLQGSKAGNLQPRMWKTYQSFGGTDPFFDYAITAIPYSCINTPCVNGTCAVDPNFFNVTCTCYTGFTGWFCDINIDDCPANNCNDGTCVDLVNDYKCDCDPGFYGTDCEDYNYCHENNCTGNGNCTDTGTGYDCTCEGGFFGTDCEHIDECYERNCSGKGNCTDLVKDYLCTCELPYYGKNCQNFDDCFTQNCSGVGNCTNIVGDYICSCEETFYGKDCEHFDDCHSQNCSGLGNCTDLLDDYQCICEDAFTGKDCELINDCYQQTCSGHGTCTDLDNDYNCTCDIGFYGTNCELFDDDCQGITCSGHGNCTDIGIDYLCECGVDFYGRDCQYGVFELVIDGYNASLSEGDNLTLTCSRTDDKPLANVSWLFMHSTPNDPTNLSQSTTYWKQNVTVADSGNYTCEENTGELSVQALVSVLVLPYDVVQQDEDNDDDIRPRVIRDISIMLVVAGTILALLILIIILVPAMYVIAKAYERRTRIGKIQDAHDVDDTYAHANILSLD